MLLVFGSLNLDYVAFVSRAPGPGETVSGMGFAMHPGGKGANQAYAAARLGAAVRLAWDGSGATNPGTRSSRTCVKGRSTSGAWIVWTGSRPASP